MKSSWQDGLDAGYGLLMILLIALVVAVCLESCADGQNIENQPIASQYSTWQVAGYAADTYTFAPNTCRVQGGASFFNAFTVGVPVKLVDGDPAETEIVTPTNVVINNNTCSIAISPVNHHQLPFYLTSATGGLQEALIANHASPTANTVILDNKFYDAVGSANVASVIAATSGYSTLGLVDITQTPYVWYRWNGSQYVEASSSQDITSIFGRTGAVVAEAGDYTCDQITGCLTSAPVTSVFGRTGAVVAASGDYTCLEVTGCQPNSGLGSTQQAAVLHLASSIGATDTTIPMTSSTAQLAPQGVVIVDGEWIEYDGISGDDLLNANRGYHQTTAASHASDANVFTVIYDFGSPTQLPQNYILASAGNIPAQLVVSCDSPDTTSNISLQVGCPGVETYISAIDGSITQSSGSGLNRFNSPLGIGPGGGKANITDSGLLFDTSRQNQSTVPQGFGAGIAGPVISNQPLTVAAPSIINFANTGSTTWSYECTGTDVDGSTYPGTVASITNGPATITSGEILVSCPFSAGAASQTVWRTAGGPNQGYLFAGPQPAVVPDAGTSASAGTPPASNSSIPKVCTAGEQFCEISGTTSTPTVTCASGTRGWTFHNVAAASTPFAYVCNGISWVTAY